MRSVIRKMATGFWKALFKPGPLVGATLEYASAWEVPAPARPIPLSSAIRVLLSQQGIVALEGVSIHPEVKQTLSSYLTAPLLKIRPGTVYPQSEWLHIRATDGALNTLNELVNTFPDPEICNHLYAYEGRALLLEWHDAFDAPIHVAGTVWTDVMAAFCSALGVSLQSPRGKG